MNTVPTPVSLISRNLSAGLPVVAAEGNPSAAYQAAKRLLDIVGSLALILVLSPLLLTLLIVLTITTGASRCSGSVAPATWARPS